MTDPIGTLFTTNTFSIDCTKEIIYFLDLRSFANLRCVNKFCNTICNEETVQKDRAFQSLKEGSSRKNTVMRLQIDKNSIYGLRENPRLLTVGEDYLCLHLNDSCVLVNKTTGQVQKDINCKDYFGKDPNYRFKYENQIQFLRRDYVLIAFFQLAIFKSDKTINNSEWIFYNLATDKIDRSLSFNKFPRYQSPIHFHYDNKDTIHIFTQYERTMQELTWNTVSNSIKGKEHAKSRKYEEFSFDNELCVFFDAADTIKVWHWPSATLKASIKTASSYRSSLSISGNVISSYMDGRRSFWKFENDTISYLGFATITTYSDFNQFIAKSLYPTPLGFSFYYFQSTEETKDTYLYLLQEMNFTGQNKVKTISFVNANLYTKNIYKKY